MNRAIAALACASLAAVMNLAFPAAGLAAAKPKPTKSVKTSIKTSITCPFLKNGSVTFDVPAKSGDLPKAVDFDYPSKATSFSFRDGNLFLMAVDEGDAQRVRVMVSAQLNKKSGAYEGQIFVDMGGNQLMLHNGPVRCTVDTE